MSSDSFSGEALYSGFIIIRTVFQPPASRFEARSSLTRRVKAEIVSPYYRILINTGIGNLTVPLVTASGRRAGSTRQVGKHKKPLLPL